MQRKLKNREIGLFMFNQTKFFKIIFMLSIFILVLLYGFTAGAWHYLDASKTLFFEININRILYSSRYTLAITPVMSTLIFSIMLLLVTKGEIIDNTKPFIIKKLMFTIMFELIIMQLYIQFLLIKRSVITILPNDLIYILLLMSVVVGVTFVCLIIYVIYKHRKDNKLKHKKSA